MILTHTSDPRMVDLGLLVVRVAFGGLFAAHGTQKLFGWFGGYGLKGTGEFMESLGFRPGRTFAATAGLTELVSGLLILLGFLGAAGPALVLSVMVVAVVTVHWGNGLLATSDGIELPLLYSAAAVALAVAGPGAYSLDARLGFAVFESWGAIAGILALGVFAGLLNVASRRPPPAPHSA